MNVIPLEPDSDAFAELRRNSIVNGILDLVDSHGITVGLLAGRAGLRSQKFGSGLTRFSMHCDFRCCGWERREPVTTLDRLTSTLDQVDLVIVDVRGYKSSEPASSPRTLPSGRRLILEVWHGSGKDWVNVLLQGSVPHIVEMRYKVP